MRIRHALVPSVAAGAALGMVALTPLAAHAQSGTLGDKYNDVSTFSSGQSYPGSTTNINSADINQVAVNHTGGTKGQITWAFIVKDLKPKDEFQAFGVIKTDTNKIYGVNLFNKANGQQYLALERKTADGAVPVPCGKNDLSATSSPTPNTITLRVKRSCVGNPESVRFGAGIIGIKKDGDLFLDDASVKAKVTDFPANQFDFKIGPTSYAAG